MKIVILWTFFHVLHSLAISSAMEHSKQPGCWMFIVQCLTSPFVHLLIKSIRTLDTILQMNVTHKAVSISFSIISATASCILQQQVWKRLGLQNEKRKNGVKFVSSHLGDILLSLHCMQLLLSREQIVKWFFYLFQAIFYDDYCCVWWY